MISYKLFNGFKGSPPRLREGDTVLHRNFGKGTVVACKGGRFRVRTAAGEGTAYRGQLRLLASSGDLGASNHKETL